MKPIIYNPACHEEFKGNDVCCARPSPHHRRTHSSLRAGSSPERRADGEQDCPNPCRRDDGPVDCKTQSVRRRLAEELGCCGCTKPQTPCLVTEDTDTCCQRRPAAPRCSPKPNSNPAVACVDPVDQIINEGLMPQKRRSSRRRSSCCSNSSRSRLQGPSGRERRARPSTTNHSNYQPDYFDDHADMSNWQQHRDHGRHGGSRERPSSPPPRPKCLAFEPYVDNEQYAPAAAATPGMADAVQPTMQDENDGRRQNMQRELERLDEQRSYLMQCLQRECKIIEMMREYKRQQRASSQQQPCGDDRGRLQQMIDEEKRKLAEFQRLSRQQDECCPAAPSGTYEIPAYLPTESPTWSPARNRESVCAASSTPPRQRRKLRYQPPSPDTDTEDECCEQQPKRRLLKYIPPSPSDSSCDGDANECGRQTPEVTTSRSSDGPSRAPSLQDSFTYYYRAIRNGAPPVTAEVPQNTSSTWSTSR